MDANFQIYVQAVTVQRPKFNIQETQLVAGNFFVCKLWFHYNLVGFVEY